MENEILTLNELFHMFIDDVHNEDMSKKMYHSHIKYIVSNHRNMNLDEMEAESRYQEEIFIEIKRHHQNYKDESRIVEFKNDLFMWIENGGKIKRNILLNSKRNTIEKFLRENGLVQKNSSEKRDERLEKSKEINSIILSNKIAEEENIFKKASFMITNDISSGKMKELSQKIELKDEKIKINNYKSNSVNNDAMSIDEIENYIATPYIDGNIEESKSLENQIQYMHSKLKTKAQKNFFTLMQKLYEDGKNEKECEQIMCSELGISPKSYSQIKRRIRKIFIENGINGRYIK
ncbi:hypothetical protein AB6905_07535 [Carnobacterium maltaromaticum]|uniref:hypothetical protein n=1 Tax=Carnobacterium maltaromaticum TaxID=2751 RepID=UPI0039BDA9DE